MKNKQNKQNKYEYLTVIQQHFGQYWEDVDETPTRDKENVKHLLREYRLLGYPTRAINRRELI